MFGLKRRRIPKTPQAIRRPGWQTWRPEGLESRRLLTAAPTVIAGSGQVAIGDFNGDGVPDEAVVGAGTSSAVSIRYGRADGSYATPVNLLPGLPSDSVAAGDFTGNGELDLAVVRKAIPGVSPAVVIVFMNQGNFEFTLSSVEVDDNNPTSITTGDLTGDGKTSLAMTTAQGDLETRQGNGDGTFQAPQLLTAGAHVDHVAIGDFNGDGKNDLVATSQADKKVSVLPGLGQGAFGSPVTSALNVAPTSFVLGDFNGDSLLDVATTNAGKNGQPASTVSIDLNQGSNHVDSAQAFPVSNTPIAITAGDLNGDGKLDLVTANSLGNNVSVVLGHGNGLLGETHDYALPAAPAGVGVGDANHDGALDILAPSAPGAGDRAVFGRGDGTFAAPSGYMTGPGARTTIFAKIDNDSLVNDYIALTPTGFQLRLQKADGSYGPSVGYLSAKTPVSFAVGDLNGDGNNDVVIAEAGQIEEFFGTGQGTFTNGPIVAGPTNPGPIAVGNFRGNGKVDVVVTYSDPSAPDGDPYKLGGFAYETNSGNGKLTQTSTTAIGAPVSTVLAADINADGKLDIVVGSSANHLFIFNGNGDGTFGTPGVIATTSAASSVALGDFNGDHKLDVAILDRTTGTLRVLFPNGGSNGAENEVYQVGTNATGLVAADVDGDGKLDLAAIRNTTTDPSSPQPGRLEVFRGHGDGTFQPMVSTLVGASPVAIATPNAGTSGKASLTVVNADSFDVTTFTQVALDLTLPQGIDITGVKGLLVPGLQPATFVDTNTNAAAGQYAAIIDWGDGTTSAGTIVDLGTLYQGSGPRIGEQFGVNGDHKYIGNGPYVVHVTITKSDGETLETSSTAHVVDTPLAVTPKNLTVVEGQPLYGEFATFTDLANEPASNFTVKLDWGAIAAPTSAKVTVTSDFASQTYHVTNSGLATATFAKPGTYSVLVTITDSSGFTSTTTTTVTVTDAPTHLSGVTNAILATEDLPLHQVTVGFFTDGNPLARSDDFLATIDWGDQTGTTTGKIIATAFPATKDPNTGAIIPGYVLYSIDGDHTYNAPGTFVISVSLTDVSSGAKYDVTSKSQVTPYPLQVSPVSGLVAARGRLTGGLGLTLATFVDGGGDHAASDFTTTIHWGDGSMYVSGRVAVQGFTPEGTPGPSTIFKVMSDHVYNSAGTFTITVTIRDNLGRTRSIQETIHVAPTPINLTGHLDPASDTGISNSDGITNQNRPTYLGSSEPATIVSLYAVNTAGGGAFLVGQTRTDVFGHWQLTTSTISDGTYNIVARAVTPSGGASATTNLAPLTVATAPPRVLNVTVNPRANQATIVMQAGIAGFAPASVGNAAVYNLSMISARPSRVYSSRIVSISDSATPTAAVSVTLSFQGIRRMARGQYVLSVTPGGLTDRAGNALNGTYDGTFPTSGGPATGSFAVKFTTDGRTATLLPVVPKAPVVRRPARARVRFHR